ncbi:MAG: GTPase-activating protein [Peltula sp. TS41687]|nr:MAG: GTPase-activating protein [Peltula sp. TS41687]
MAEEDNEQRRPGLATSGISSKEREKISDKSVSTDIHPAHHESSGHSRSLTDQRLPSSAIHTRQDLEPSHPMMTSTDSNDRKVDMTSPGSKEEISQTKSTPSTHRISATSLDDVNLEEVMADDQSARSRSSTVLSRISAGPPGTQSNVPSIQLPKQPISPLESIPQLPSMGKRPTLTPAPPTRKLTSPFSWLSRNISLSSKDPIPPPVTTTPTHAPNPPSTASSTSTTGAHSELMLSRISEVHGSNGNFQDPWRASKGNSLRDRFKMQRMKEEAGIGPLGDAAGGDFSRSPLASPTGQSINGAAISGEITEKFEDAQEGHPMSPSASVSSATIDPNLAPGTASGISVGPPSRPDSEALADWDLWQALVYEGPVAVAQKSSEELSQAIAGGIPSAIRGVVWQVLANSKNEELERVFERLTGSLPDRRSSRKPPVDDNTASAATEAQDDVVNGVNKPKSNELQDVPATDPVSSSDPQVSTLSVNGNKPPPLPKRAPPPLPSRENSETWPQFRPPPSPGYDLDVTMPDPSVVQRLEKTIKRDLGARTSFFKYSASAGLQDSLLKVCKAYAIFDKAVGYAQGMSFMIMPLLFNMPEEEAFCLFVRLMYDYKLREMFVQDMPGLHLHLYQFQRLVEDHEPALFCHLHRSGVDPNLYATQWFLTLFAYRFPLQLVLRVYDLVLSEGLEGSILRFGLVLMQKNAENLLQMTDMSTMTQFLKERLFDVYIDQAPSANSILESGFFGSSGGSDKAVYRADALVKDACAIKLTDETLKGYTAEWMEKVRTEKEREAEMESLKSANTNLSVRVRSLEERIEKFDTEHVQVASELVRSKVENEELKEENDSLKEQLENLKRAVESQPEEVEARLKEEMDRIMQRNIEVHNENRALEEQMAEMEKDLVDAKMRYAEVYLTDPSSPYSQQFNDSLPSQINSAHETLKQRWNDLKKALGD